MGASNPEELRKLVEPKMQAAVENLIDEIIEKNRDIIERVVYSSEYSGEYQRTGEFKEAWSNNKGDYGNVGGADFDYDSSKITTFGRPNNSPPQHESIYGESQAEYLADLIYYGHKGIWNVDARNAFKSLDKWLSKSQFRILFEEGMTRAGIQWKKSTGSPVKMTLREI